MASDAAASASSWQTLLVAAAWIRLNLSRCGYCEGIDADLLADQIDAIPDGATLGSVENQDSTGGLVVIQALDGTIRTDRRPMGEDGAALSG